MALKPGTSAYLSGGYLARTEQVLLETHPSKWFYFPFPVLYFVLFGFADYLVATTVYAQLPAVGWLTASFANLVPSSFGGLPNPRILLLVASLVGTLAVIGWLLARLYEWVGDAYVVTEDRIIEQKGIFRTFQQYIPLNQIRDVDVTQRDLTSRIFRFGLIRFRSLSQMEPPNMTLEQAMLNSAPRRLRKPRKRRFVRSVFNPRYDSAWASGVEFWVGVPSPLRIERTIEQALRNRPPPGVSIPSGGPSPT
jgi:membrane protein YdbS with pleckstrin-like domain